MFSRRYIMVAMATTLAFLLHVFFNNRPAEEVLPAKKKVRAKDDFKKDHPDLYHATMRMLKTKYGEEYPSYPRNYRHQELKKAEEQLQRLRFRRTSYQWDERGPSNVPGRTRGLVVDPRDPTQNTWLAGAVGGGVWKTTNGGLSWTHLTSNMPNLAIGSLAIAPSNPDVIYAGTGEAGIDGVGATGDGLYKSTDGGNTWVHLSSTSQFIDFENVSRIVVHPQNENILLVAVTADTQNYRTIGWQSAIYRSEDGGNSWIKTYESLGFSVEQLVAHPSDFNILYATVNRIGVLKSTDSGRTWRLCKKGMGQVSRVEIAISPTNPNVMYASCEGTLSGNNSDIYVSEDGGESWMLMIEEKKPDGSAGTNPDWLANQGWYNNTIMVHPFNDKAVYVGGVSLWFLERLQGQGTSINAVTGLSLIGTESFLFNEIRLFTDNGTNLQEGDFTEVEIRFGNGRKQKAHRFTVPAGSTSGVPANQYTYRDYIDVPFEVWDITNNRQLMVSFRDQAADGKFNLLPDFNASREYIFVHALPYNAQQPSPSVAQQGGHTFRSPYLLWMRTNDGVIFNENQLPNSLIRINYEKINTVFKRSTCIADPYGEFNKRNRQVHPDHHNLLAQIRGNEYRILNANDGGVYATDYSTGNAGTAEGSWRMAGSTYNTTQFYGVDKRPNLNMYIGGTQDNGTWVSGNVSNPDATTAYRFVWGGDGFEVVWSGNPNKVMFSSQFNGIGRNLNGFQSTITQSATNGITDNGPFISRLTAHKKDHDLVFTVGSSGVWRTDNFGDEWKLAEMDNNWTFNSLNTPVKVSLANPQVVWVGAAMYANLSPQVSRDGGLTFRKTTVFADLGSITDFGTHPYEEGTAYVLFSQYSSPKVLRTKDFGQTWEDISGFAERKDRGFPNVPVFSLVVLPHQPKTIWVGTEIGIFESTDDGNSWHKLVGNFPATVVWDLKIVDDQVIAATHGRGIWTVTIPDIRQAPQQEIVLSPRIDNVFQNTFDKSQLFLQYSLRSPYDSTQVLIDGKHAKTIARNSFTLQDNLTFDVNNPKGIVEVQLKSFRQGKTYLSAIQKVIIYDAPVTKYFTDFSAGGNDFYSNEQFGVYTEIGFHNPALHSLHPYPNDKNLIAYFLRPIVVARENAFIRYRDIAIVEIGEPNSVFGQSSFYDYVVVEGSKDGRSWIPLKNGYDARSVPSWRTAYLQKGKGTASMFADQEIDLRNTFSAGDIIVIRFRLFADDAENGWGWVIDDLAIQDNTTSTEDELSEKVSIYPNPTSGKFTLDYSLLSTDVWQVEIMDATGKCVEQLRLPTAQTSYRFDWSNKNKGLYFLKIYNGNQSLVKRVLLQ